MAEHQRTNKPQQEKETDGSCPKIGMPKIKSSQRKALMKADDFLAASLAAAISISNLGRVIPVLDTKKGPAQCKASCSGGGSNPRPQD